MKKFATWLVSLLWFVSMLSFAVELPARALEEGFDYQNIIPPVPPHNKVSGRVEVVEMFWYGCPHCLHFEPILKKWVRGRPANVDFIRVPAIFHDSWEPLARAFYTAESLGIADRIHDPLFKAVQEDHRKLDTIETISDFFFEQGVARNDFNSAYSSFSVETRIRRARDLTKRYGIDGVPTIIVNGKYRTSGTLTGGLEKIPPIIDALIQKELAVETP
ncbi:Thiol:disulfide interchange protein [Gammaproteobacteria bacterium]